MHSSFFLRLVLWFFYYIQDWHGSFTDMSCNKDMNTLGLAGFYRYIIVDDWRNWIISGLMLTIKSLLESKGEELGKFPIMPLKFQDPDGKVWGGSVASSKYSLLVGKNYPFNSSWFVTLLWAFIRLCNMHPAIYTFCFCMYIFVLYNFPLIYIQLNELMLLSRMRCSKDFFH